MSQNPDAVIIHGVMAKLRGKADKYPHLRYDGTMPHRRHWADLHGGTRVCFTRVRFEGEEWKYHLSVSRTWGKASDEVVATLLCHLGAPEGVEETPGMIDNGRIRHFWWPCDSSIVS